MSVHELETRVRAARVAYYQEGKPLMPDVEYDALVTHLRSLEPRSAELAAPEPGGGKVPHLTPMGSLAVATDPEVWCAGTRAGDYVTQPKYDGMALSLVYHRGNLVRAVSRGNGLQGEDLTAAARNVRGIPGSIQDSGHEWLEVRGEVILPYAAFDATNGYSNPRNAAAGIMRRKDAGSVSERGLEFIAYACPQSTIATEVELIEWLSTMGFRTAATSRVYNSKQLQVAYDGAKAERNLLEFQVDGLVVKVNSRRIQAQLGSSGADPRWAAAFKFEASAAITKLTGAQWRVARTGKVTGVGIVDPVVLGGVTVRRVSLHNERWCLDRRLAIGDLVTLVRAGDVIPHILGVSLPGGAEPLVWPDCCPQCGEPLARDGAFLRCVADCGKFAGLVHWCKVMGMDGVGWSTLVRLRGVTRPVDLYYELEPSQVALLGAASRENLLARVAASRQEPYARVIAALGIPGVGAVNAEKMAAGLRRLSDLVPSGGVGPVVSEEVRVWVAGHRDELLALDLLGVGQPHGVKGAAPGPLAGQV